MADYTLVHPVWDNVTRVAQGADERDRYMQAGWVLKDTTAPTPTPKTRKADAKQAPAATGTEAD